MTEATSAPVGAVATRAPDAHTVTIDPAIVERVIIHGDLSQLTPAQKNSYYRALCESIGLNVLTKPFEYLKLSGKEILYTTRVATDQLRKLHHVSITIVARDVVDDCYAVTARATLPDGRTDESIGAVPIARLTGEAKANALMKAETKSKRRVTLAICGLGMLDETEVSSIDSGAAPSPAALGTDARRVREVRPATDKQGRPFYVVSLHGDDRDYVTRDSDLADELAKFMGTDHRLRLAYRVREAGAQTFYRIDSFGVADDE